MNNLKSELLERKTSGHESVIQRIKIQQEELAEKIHILSIIRVSELLHQLVDNKDVAKIGAKYFEIFYRRDEEDSSWLINFYLQNKDHNIITYYDKKSQVAYHNANSVVQQLDNNQLNKKYFTPNPANEFEISKEGIEKFTNTVLNDKLQALLIISTQALLLEDLIEKPSPSPSKKKINHKI